MGVMPRRLHAGVSRRKAAPIAGHRLAIFDLPPRSGPRNTFPVTAASGVSFFMRFPSVFVSRHLPFGLAALLMPAALFAQNYGSYMNSAQRAREASRYESALLQGTYNNPMLQKSTVNPSLAYRGLGQAQRDEEAEKFARQQAEQRRRYEEQRERERQAATAAYFQARYEEALRQRQNFERNYAETGLKRLAYQDLTAMTFVQQNRERVRSGQLRDIPVHELYATALSLRRTPLPSPAGGAGRSAEYPVAQLALRALAEGQLLPAVLLSDEFLRDRDFLRLIASEGTELDRMLPIYYTGGYGWIAEDELEMAKRQGVMTAEQRKDIEGIGSRIKSLREVYHGRDAHEQVLKVFGESQLFPWHKGRARPSFHAQAQLAALRQSRPVSGYFMTALYEERMRVDPTRPSPWADFLFERAAQAAGPGFITEVARLRREASRENENAAFRRWTELPAGDGAGRAALDAHLLWRVAGRLILGHDLAGLSAPLADRANAAAITRRLGLAHDILWELTTRGDRQALTIQYLAAIQEERSARPSLFAYLNAYHWVLDWDQPPADREETAMLAASFLETLPASRLGRLYPDSTRAKAIQSGMPASLQEFPYTQLGYSSWYSTGYLESLPVQAAIFPAVSLHRGRVDVESEKLAGMGDTIRSSGFAAQLARHLQVAVARARKDAKAETTARDQLERLVKAAAAPAPALDPAELERGLLRFGEAALTFSGSTLLGEPLPLAAAADSESLLEAVSLRNLAVKPFLPHVRLPPLPPGVRTARLGTESALRRTVAVQALANLDESLAAAVNLPGNVVLDWLRSGATQGDPRCRLRLAQLALRGGPLAGGTGLTTAAAEKWLVESVEAGVPGAVEFQFERLRGQSQQVAPEQLFTFVHTARAKGSPLAAQAWLDALDDAGPWSVERAVQETTALRVARDDMREGATDRWWKALCRWSARLRANRTLLIGRPDADEVAREVTRLVRQTDSIARVYPLERLYLKAYDVFPHFVIASANLPASPAATALREVLADSFHVKEELRYGSFVPFETALYYARTEKDATAREFAAMDAARWYVINATSRVEHAGLVMLSHLPAEPDRHPLWDPAIGIRFTGTSLAAMWNVRALPEAFAGSLKKLGGLIARLPAMATTEELKTLVTGYQHFTSSAQFVEGFRTRPEAAALVDAFDRIARQQAGLAGEIYRASARIATRSYALACYDRALQPAGTWVGLHAECFSQLTAADHVAHLRRVAGFDLARADGGATDIMGWMTDAVAKATKAGDTATLTELGGALRQVAARWSAFPVATPDRWGTAAFLLTAEAERIAPAVEKSAEILRVLQPRAAALGQAGAVYGAVLEWIKRATSAGNREALRALSGFAPREVEEAIDALDGSPKRKAAQAEYERKLALIDPIMDLLKAGQNVGVAVRTLQRLSSDGMMVHAWSKLNAVKSATLGAGGVVTLPNEPRAFHAVVQLLSDGSVSWDDYDEIKVVALALSPVAQRLWETRASWRAGREHHLMWIVHSYAKMGQAWAIAAWPTLKDNPSPEMRYSLTTSGLFRALGVTPVSEAEAKQPVFQEADRAQKDLPQAGDDPLAELSALLAMKKP